MENINMTDTSHADYCNGIHESGLYSCPQERDFQKTKNTKINQPVTPMGGSIEKPTFTKIRYGIGGSLCNGNGRKWVYVDFWFFKKHFYLTPFKWKVGNGDDGSRSYVKTN